MFFTGYASHVRIGLLTVQVNSAYSRVIANTPYAVVFGREPKTAPLFGRGALVDEIDVIEGDSYSTAYDQSDTELEVISSVLIFLYLIS